MVLLCPSSTFFFPHLLHANLGPTVAQAFVFMDDPFDPREFGWTENCESGISNDLFADEIELNYQPSEDEELPFVRHGLVLEADPKELCST